MTITRVIRLKALRHRVAVKFLWWYLTGSYDLREPQVIKIRPTALALGLKVRTMRRALRALVAARYLDPVVLATKGTPGEYVAGPRAYRLPVGSTPRPATHKAHRGPRPHPDQLTMTLPSREDCDHAA
jgi:hypothetical protein